MSVEIKVPDIGDFSDVPVVSVLVSVGDGALIMVLEGEAAAAPAPKTEAEPATAPAPAAAPAPAPKPAAPAAAPATPAVTDAGFGKVHASPSVRAFARTLGIDLAQVNGTGRNP